MKGKTYLTIEGRREGYAIDQCRKSMTVGELISYLENWDDDMEIYLDNDNGYTYGSITESSFEEKYEEDEDDEEYEEA